MGAIQKTLLVLFLKSGVGINYMHAAGEEVELKPETAQKLVKLNYVKIMTVAEGTGTKSAGKAKDKVIIAAAGDGTAAGNGAAAGDGAAEGEGEKPQVSPQ